MGWITGRHGITAALEKGAAGTLYLQRKDRNAESLAELARNRDVQVRYVTAEKLTRLAGTGARGAALHVDAPDGRGSDSFGGGEHTVDLDAWLLEHHDDPPSPVVALDHITDPHNLGAILRSVHWFGAALVVIPERRSAAEGDVVSRSSAGAVAYTTISYVTNLRNALETLKHHGYWTYAADGCGVDVREVTIHSPSVLVLGAEGRGISPGLEKVVDQTVAIPRDPRNERSTVDSLNVSVSAGVLLYELFRRKGI